MWINERLQESTCVYRLWISGSCYLFLTRIVLGVHW